MAKKFDTNPLDPEFPEKAKAASTVPLDSPTRGYADPSETEEQTRRFDRANFTSYKQSSGTGRMPDGYQTTPLVPDPQSNSPSRKVAKVGLPENILVALPYFPFSLIGLIAGILELLFVPKSEAKVRFHAAQGVAAHLGILIVTTILGIVDSFIGIAGIASMVFWVVTTIMLCVFTYKAWKGEPVHIEPVADLTNWLEEKIKPWN